MHQFCIFVVLALIVTLAKCQLSLDSDDNFSKPTRYVSPYTSLGLDDDEGVKDEQYYKPSRRAERIPATAYQYDEAIPEEEYYRPQPRQKIEPENYRYQPSSSSHKIEQDNLRYQQSTRLRVAAKKQHQAHHQQQVEADQVQQTRNGHQQPSVEQYLKEVNPTTKTTYQRPSNYLRFSGQNTKQQQQLSEETQSIKQQQLQQPIRYVLQPELHQKSYQDEAAAPPAKPIPKSQPFNLVAYQNALNAQQRLLAAEGHDDAPSKSSIYVQQSIHKKPSKKQKSSLSSIRSQPTPAPPVDDQYEYFPQRQLYSSESVRDHPQSLRSSSLYQKSDPNYQVDEPVSYQEQKDLDYPTPAPLTSRNKLVRPTSRPSRKLKYQPNDEPIEDYTLPSKYQQQKEQQFDEQEEEVEEQPAVSYRRPLTAVRQSKASSKYSTSDDSERELRYQSKYQGESLGRSRAPLQYHQETSETIRGAESRPSFPSRYLRQQQQYQEESQQVNQYHSDLAYQPSADSQSRYRSRGLAVSYKQDLPNSNVRYHRNLDISADDFE